jgi:hypothetical protein
MPGRTLIVQLTDDQAAILGQLAADRDADPADFAPSERKPGDSDVDDIPF